MGPNCLLIPHRNSVVERMRCHFRLCTAALLSSYGKKVVVCESHTQPGGCAHGFDRGGYKFDSGPSLFSGMYHTRALAVTNRGTKYVLAPHALTLW